MWHQLKILAPEKFVRCFFTSSHELPFMLRTLLKHGFLFLLYGFVCSAAVVIYLFIDHLQSRPDLQPWHLAALDGDYNAARTEDITSFADYLELEDKLFAQLQQQVYNQTEPEHHRILNRYHQGSLADPDRFDRNWNRTFELEVAKPRGGVLLIHGLSDSPYSMRRLGEVFHAMDFWVVGIRLPGHGTAPSGLLNVTWQDFAAVTDFSANHVKQRIGEEKPFYIAGYSTGAALAVENSLRILAGSNDPMPDGLVLLAPAIGVSPIAALAVWQEKLSAVPGLEKAAWESIEPEYDPFRYRSFAVNAGDQIYNLTSEINRLVSKLDQGQGIKGFPKVLAFQSIVDATISTPALISGLFDRLANEEHELILFDINRNAEAEPLLVARPEATTQALLKNRFLPFKLTLISNTSIESHNVSEYQKQANSDLVTKKPLTLSWPRSVLSLSHVALPFPPNDVLYGVQRNPAHAGIYLGRINILGERGLLLISADEVIRLRYNPFFDYLQHRVEAFVTNNH